VGGLPEVTGELSNASLAGRTTAALLLIGDEIFNAPFKSAFLLSPSRLAKLFFSSSVKINLLPLPPGIAKTLSGLVFVITATVAALVDPAGITGAAGAVIMESVPESEAGSPKSIEALASISGNKINKHPTSVASPKQFNVVFFIARGEITRLVANYLQMGRLFKVCTIYQRVNRKSAFLGD